MPGGFDMNAMMNAVGGQGGFQDMMSNPNFQEM